MAMTPYYNEDGITIYHGDCREMLPLAGLIVSDPPYDESGAWLIEQLRGRSGAVFGYPELLVSWCVAAQIVPVEWVTWWPRTPKPVSGGSKLPVSSEHVALFGKVDGGRNAVRPRSGSDRVLHAIHAGRGHSATARLGDVWTDPAPNVGFNSHKRLHPNEKPVSVLSRLIQLFETDTTVLDPFMGSGTTLRAAKDLGRRAVGIEIEEKYCEIAVQRLAQGVLAFDGQ